MERFNLKSRFGCLSGGGHKMQEEQRRLRFGPAGVDFQERINFARMREYRKRRTMAKLKEHGIAAALLTMTENCRYVAGVRMPVHVGPSEYGVLAFADDPDPIVYQLGAHLQLTFHAPWIKPENMRWGYRMWGLGMGHAAMEFKVKQFAKQIKQDLGERHLEKEKFGVDAVSDVTRAAFEAEGLNIVGASGALMEARVIKSEDEINCLKMAGALVDRAWWEIYNALRPGVSAREVAAKAFDALWRHGVEAIGMVAIRTGPDTAPIYLGTSPTDRIIQYGDMVYVDIWGVQFAGYRTCYYRTFKVGCKPTETEKEWYKKTRDPLYAVMDAIKPGATTADSAKHFLPPSAFGASSEEEVFYNLCHGIGLAQYEAPITSRTISFKYPQVYEKGMTMACETYFGESWVGGCQLENVIVVTDNGYENLYTMPDEEIIVPEHSLLVR